MSSLLAIARCDHQRSMPTDTAFDEKDGAYVLSSLGESAHRIQCPHACKLEKLRENRENIATMEIFIGLMVIWFYISCKFFVNLKLCPNIWFMRPQIWGTILAMHGGHYMPWTILALGIARIHTRRMVRLNCKSTSIGTCTRLKDEFEL